MSEQHRKNRTTRRRRSRARERLAHWIGIGFYLLIAASLIGWELQEQGGLYTSDTCELRSAPPEQNPVINPAYAFFLNHAGPPLSPRVSVVDIDASLAAIQGNVCPARSFTADLLRAAAAEGASVIAIDKFYGPDSCPANDPNTADLRQAIASIKLPVIVGQSTHAPAEKNAKACLVLSPQLQLDGTVRGLTRLNQNVLLVPMRWQALPSDSADPNAAAPYVDSFAVAAATQLDPGLRSTKKFRTDYTSAQQPYARLTGEVEQQTASNLLCSVSKATASRDNIQCNGPAKPYDLHGKVVVIGAESDADNQVVLGESMYGFELQARYIAALLSGSTLRQIPPLFLLLPLGLYYLLSELLIPYMHIHRHPRWKLFHIEKPLLWTVAVFFLTMALGATVPLLFGRFPPLPMLLGISTILIPRLLIEGWAVLNERNEDPHGDELA
jgi:CHASE2 domain-containing sensor protein